MATNQYYIIQNKQGKWDICSINPPREDKDIWAGGFKTKEEAESYKKSFDSLQGKKVSLTPQDAKTFVKIHNKTAYREAGIKHIIGGFSAAIVGAIITIVWYSLTPPGGYYIVPGGIIIFGIYYGFKGVYYLIRSATG
ncbi:MAG: hypothetical protein KGH60_03780 [Candidatus Micrarchaeota archaeon]|nr:hypothetical protein [Candidatus Micrarchaeota archaeon]